MKEGMNNHMQLKDRLIVISEKNMNNIISLYGNCSTDDLERIVNNMVDDAVTEINEDRSRLYMDKIHNCSQCQYKKEYDYGKKIYYCNHEDRTDDMGKLGTENLLNTSPEWCPVRENADKTSAAR